MKINNRKKLIIVLGMHRSGTSAITRGLQALGVDLGKQLMPPAERNNDKGFFEDTDINALNIEMLKAINSDWHKLSPITEDNIEFLQKEGYLLRAVNLLRIKTSSPEIFAFKDPRVAKLLPFWNLAISHLDLDVCYVLALRHPISVAKSLSKRDGFSSVHSYFLWVGHMLESLRGSAGRHRVVIDYDRLMHSPEGELKRITEACDLDLDCNALNAYKNEFLDSRLRHTVYQLEDLDLENNCPLLAKDIFRVLSNVSRDEQSLDDSTISLEIHRWLDEFDRLKELLVFSDRQSDQLMDQNHKLQERDERLAVLGLKLKECDEQIAVLRNIQQESDGKITGLNKVLQQSNGKLNSLNHALMEANNELNTLRLALSQSNEHNHALQETIANIFSSDSWKITSPLREISRKIQKFKIFAWVIFDLQRRTGTRTLVIKGVNFLRRGGIISLKQKIEHYFSFHYQANKSQSIIEEKNERPRVDYSNIKLSEYDIISFDIFDTAIIRLTQKPTDVFSYIEEKHGIPGFAEWRINREAEVRREMSGIPEIHLKDIYKNHPDWMRFELSAEFACCKANPEIFDIYRKALIMRKSIAFVSDMYLPKGDVEDLLNKSGYTSKAKLLVSSEDELIKGDGSRFQDLADEWAGRRVLHIGDNKIADYDWPQIFGFSSIHYQDRDSFFEQDRLLASLYPILKDNNSIRISHLLGSYRYWKLGLIRAGTDSFWRSLGFLFAGPLLLGFANSIYSKIREDKKIGGIYFLARDGDIIKKVFDLAHPDKKHLSHYLFASRRCMTFPLFSLPQSKITEDILRLYTLCDDGVDADQILSRIGNIDSSNLGPLRDELIKLEKQKKLNESNIKGAIFKHRHLIETASSLELKSLLSYLDKVGFFDKDSLVVDVGWSGTIQDCLQNITSSQKTNKVKISGSYLGVMPMARSTDKKTGYLFDHVHTDLYQKLSPYFDFIELLTSSSKESVMRIICSHGNHIEPEYFQASEEEKFRQLVAREIQQGVMEYVGLSIKLPPSLSKPISPLEFSFMCELLSTRASSDIKIKFQELKHARMPGGKYEQDIIHFAEQ